MRGEAADEDARFVESEAARLGLPCTVERADVPRLARERGIGSEVAGRDARYEFLTRLAKSLGAACVAFGHQADDQAETVLMRVIRGAGPRGMGGIPCVREAAGVPSVRIVRPLLDCSRLEIEKFLRERGLHPRLDSTNLSQRYLRNRLRARVLPEMKRVWGRRLPAELRSLAALAQRLQARADAIRDALGRLHAVHMADRYVETDSDWLRRAPPAILPDLVQFWMKRTGLWQKMLSAKQYERIASLIGRGSGCVTLPGPALASVRRGAFILCAPGSGRRTDYRVQLAVPGVTPIEPLGGRIETKVLSGGIGLLARKRRGNAGRIPRDGRAIRGGLEELLDLEKITLPLFAQFPRPGDRMRPMGAPGSRKLQDIFTDLHVPAPLRTRTLVVMMRERPIWIVGLRMAEEVRLTELTRKALRLRYIPYSKSIPLERETAGSGAGSD